MDVTMKTPTDVSGRLTALQVMQDAPVIPVIVLNDVAHAVPMARALVAGGIRMLEVTLRTKEALACMEAIARDVPEAVLGAGTMGLAAIAGLRRYVPDVRIIAGARYPHQRQFAKEFGADVVVAPDELPRAVRRAAGCPLSLIHIPEPTRPN